MCSEQAPDEKLKFLAQLIHEPERTETDNNRQTIERALGCVLWVLSPKLSWDYFLTGNTFAFNRRTAIDQFTRLKNTAAKLANPDSEFALGQVEAPPPSPEDAENITMAAFQSRQNVRTACMSLNRRAFQLLDAFCRLRCDFLTVSMIYSNSKLHQICYKEFWAD
jgi:hypothetical protein